jgi:hypothetical protein
MRIEADDFQIIDPPRGGARRNAPVTAPAARGADVPPVAETFAISACWDGSALRAWHMPQGIIGAPPPQFTLPDRI